ncbi:MAG: hypothetical protein FWG26_06160 [Betaproteobacteria bacterium]|jgi:hypothetical protein|nr:hypothetical protein [Betaproteobacteria bacterium]
MTLNELIETIFRSIHETNEEHKRWTDAWVTHYGVEQYIVGNIARSIMKLKDRPTYAVLETPFSEIYLYNGGRPPGRPGKANKDSNRLDLALYSDEEKISYAIEFKRFCNKNCFKDFDRLCKLIIDLEKNGTLITGISASIVTSKAKADNIPELFNEKENLFSEYLKTIWKNKGIKYTFHRSKKIITDKEGQIFSALCVAIRSKHLN